MERINVSQFTYGENVLFARRRAWHPKIEFTSNKVSEAIRYIRCINYIDRRVIMLMFVHLSGMQYARLCDRK